MLIQTSALFLSDYAKLRKEDSKLIAKTMDLVFGAIEAVEKYSNPLHGIGHPEQLGENLTGLFSRRISEKHRLVYRYSENKDVIMLTSCYGHYEQ